MHKIILVVAVALLSVLLNLVLVNAVWIDEVYYNPVNSENGGEAFVLYNDGDDEINLEGWTVLTHKLNEICLFSNVSIKPKGYFLVADTGWDDNKDDWDSADFESTLSLGNVDYGITLFDSEGDVIDKIGWGNFNNIENEYYENNPALKVDEGMSLLRVDNTGDNSVDFIESVPLLRSSLSTEEINNSQKVISFNVEISSEVVEMLNFSLSVDDFSDYGYQIIPLPGKEREVRVNFSMFFSEKREDVFLNGREVNVSSSINDSVYFYESSFNVSCNQTPGNYSLSFSYGGVDDVLDYSVMPLVAIEVDALDFDVSFDESVKEWLIEGDDDMTTLDKPTIRNVGNVNVDVMLKQSSLDLGNVIPFSNIRYSFDNNDFSSDNSGVLSEDFSLIDLKLKPSFVNELGFKFNLENLNEGGYVNHLVLMGVSE